MELNSFVFSKQYGFGRVVGFRDQFVTTLFLKVGQKAILNTFLEEVNSELVNYLLSESFQKSFTDNTIKKAYNYANFNHISSLFYHDNVIKAEIIGSDDYYTSLNFVNGSFKYSCTCPVSGNCKHEAALCLYVKEILDELNYLEVEKKDDNVELTEEIKQQIDAYVLSKSANPDAIYFIMNDIEAHLTGKYILKVFMYINRIPSYKANFTSIYRGLGFNDKTRTVLMEILNDISRYSFYSDLKGSIGLGNRICTELKGSAIKVDDYNVDYYFYNKMYESFILSFFNNSNYYFRYDYFLPKAIEQCEITSNIFQGLKKFINEGRRIDSEAIRMLIDKLSVDQKVELYTDPRCNLRPTYRQIEQFSDEVKIKLLPSITIVGNDISLILNEIEKMDIEPYDMARILTRLKDCTSSEYNIERIGNVAKALPNSECFYQYIISGITDHRYTASKYKREYKPIDPTIQLENPKQIEDYFNCSYKVEEYEEDYLIRFYISSLTGNPLFVCDVDSDNNYYCIGNDIDGYHNHVKNCCYLNYLGQRFKDEIAQQTSEIRARIRKRVLKERYAQLNHDIYTIQQQFSNTTIQLHDSRKAHLEYYFYIVDNKVEMSVKVGIDKTYIVKSIYSFLDNFKTQSTERYGKNLVLTHKINNFASPDDEVLKLLTYFKFEKEYYGDSKRLSINGHLFGKLLILLKGQQIYLDDTAYQIRLKKLEPEVFIDEDYILRYSLSNDQYKTISIDDQLYVLDMYNKYIDCIDCTEKELALYRLANNNNNSEIKDMIEPFKDAVYTRFPDKITVAENLKEDFKLSILNINAYFDYVDKKIVVKTDYVKNDAELSYEQLSKQDDINKANLYLQYLGMIGFVDNELKDDAKVLSFFSMDLSELKDYCTVYLSETIKNKQIITFSPSTIRIVYENNMMQAFYEQSEYSDEELEKIIKAIRRNKKYVQLTGDRIIDISESSSKQFVKAVEDVGLDTAHLNQRNTISMIHALKGYAHSEKVSVDNYLSNMMQDIKSFKQADFEVPEITGELRNYQKDGYRWMKILSNYHMGGILADDMGLGKTIQVICTIKSDEKEKPSLIVCPKSLVFNWKNEFLRFAQNEQVIEIYGNKDERINIISKIDPNKKCTYITSYDSLRNDQDEYKVDFNYLIIDEAQYIKNVSAMKTVSVKMIKAQHKFALTGTPIENNIIDLWSIFDFIMPGYLDELSIFKSNYTNYEEYTELVRKRISPFILRRTKENVLKDLPEKFERILTAEMTVEQKKLYDAMARQAREMMKMSKGAFDVLPYLMRLRQICVDPRTFTEDFTGQSGKMELLEETVKQYVSEGHKLIIFSQFVKALNLVEKKLKDNEIGYFMITGETDGKKRIEIADSFNGQSEEKVCLISLKAGGTGLNLIGADTVIHLDPWWNVSAENQATDRTHRIGQTKTVEVIKLICSNSIEQRVIELQNLKKDLIDRLITNDDSSVTNASLEDIRFILE